jgi:hypothetical protein
MQYTSLSRSGLQVSRFALGTMNFAFVTDETTSEALCQELPQWRDVRVADVPGFRRARDGRSPESRASPCVHPQVRAASRPCVSTGPGPHPKLHDGIVRS